ncbi:sensor histidine kinase [Williamsia sp.]|uniref:sensor histidine kinase n=1 Tax=Williamsia sp. TaxID=1872085 RepID=UPI002F952212
MDTQRLLDRWNRFAQTKTLLLDSLLAAAIALVAVVPELWEHMGANTGWRITLGTVVCVALAFRRTRPDASGLVIAAAAFMHIAVDEQLSPAVSVTGVIGLYSMAAYGSVWGTRAALVLGVLAGMGSSGRFYSEAPESRSFEYNFIGAAFLAAITAGVWAVGMLRRSRMREVHSLRERARLLELERAQEAELAAVGERTRIAREMHDIIAHTLTVVIAQADGGRYAAEHDPAAATRALATIADNGRQALADMRSLLGVLRDDGPRDTRAVPGIGDLPELIDAVRAGGLPVRLESVGGPRDVSTGCGLTAFRIVQESLTNILKHAGVDAAADVELQWGEVDLTITVTDNGRGGGPGQVESGAKGVLGMRERAELHGGTLRAGARTDGPGYQVSAVLPIGGFR